MEISIQNVSMTYPNGKQALKGLNLDLGSPSLIGLLGPNGAGKSTLMKLLVAALLPTSGSILVDGQPLAKGERQLKARLGYLPQDFGLFDELTVTQFLDYMAALKGCGRRKPPSSVPFRPSTWRRRQGPRSAPCPGASASGWASPRPCWGTPPS